MSDDLDDLKSALRAATPAPDPARKAENLAVAQKNFARAQGSAGGARPMSEGPQPGLWTGVRKMLKSLSPRAVLVASTALVAVAVVTLTPMRDLMMPPDVGLAPLPPMVEPTVADTAADAVVAGRVDARARQALKSAPSPAQAVGAYAAPPQPMPEAMPQAAPDTASARSRTGVRVIVRPAPTVRPDAPWSPKSPCRCGRQFPPARPTASPRLRPG